MFQNLSDTRQRKLKPSEVQDLVFEIMEMVEYGRVNFQHEEEKEVLFDLLGYALKESDEEKQGINV